MKNGERRVKPAKAARVVRPVRASAATHGSTGAERSARAAKGDAGGLEIRAARPEDLGQLWELIRGLAVYEKLEHRVTGSPERLAQHLFGSRRIIDCLVAEQGGSLVGCAIYYLIYSTFRTQPMMWLEDLFVAPSLRGRGLGRALMAALAREAVLRGCWRLSWAVLEWNEPAMKFYESLGAERDEGGWYVYQFDEARLKDMARKTAG
jgi:GNAT superfamily N-acetyltransferase